MELLRQPEVNFRKVNENGDRRPPVADGALQLAELPIDARQMQHHFRQAHHGHVFGADNALNPGCGHTRAAHANELNRFALRRKLSPDRSSQQGAIVLATGFACRDKNKRCR